MTYSGLSGAEPGLTKQMMRCGEYHLPIGPKTWQDFHSMNIYTSQCYFPTDPESDLSRRGFERNGGVRNPVREEDSLFTQDRPRPEKVVLPRKRMFQAVWREKLCRFPDIPPQAGNRHLQADTVCAEKSGGLYQRRERADSAGRRQAWWL